MIKSICFVILLFILFESAYSQNNIPIGTWRTHFSFNKTNSAVQAGDLIYAGGDNGIFVYDKSDGGLQKISKEEGLLGGEVRAMAYDAATGKLLIGYESGNLDVIAGQEIENIDLVTDSQVLGTKSINHITLAQQFAFISTDFGVIKFDLNNNLATETYRELGINPSGDLTTLSVKMSVVQNDSIFIATEQGILAANIVENINLLDVNNWKLFDSSDGISNDPVSIIGVNNTMMYAGRDQEGVYVYSGEWNYLGDVLDDVNFFSSSNALIVADSTLFQVDNQFNPLQIDLGDIKITNAFADEGANIWAASVDDGLVTNRLGSIESIKPSGPSSNLAFRIRYIENNIYGLSGGFSNNVNPLGRNEGFYKFENNQWINFDDLPVGDISTIAEFNGNVYAGSIGGGLLELNANGESFIYDNTNSPLIGTNSSDDIRIPIIKANQNSLWVANYSSNQIHRLNRNGEWESFTIPSTLGAFIIDFIFVEDIIWLIVDNGVGGGIIVFDPENSQSRYLSSTSDNGGLPSNAVNSLVLDKEGLVWVGTSTGVSVFTNPFNVFSGPVDAVEPIFENRLLLSDEIINDIEVDGGNRKWIATNSGAWLFNDDADRQIQFFNTQNSPLPSNVILDIAIQENTGEVFFATNSGIVSYRAGSTEGEISHGNVEIFPNPVREDFIGNVGISGLASDVTVKITDVSGKLIWETQANGGTATWGVRDYNGNRAATGIYLIFSSSQDGEETFVGKLAVVN